MAAAHRFPAPFRTLVPLLALLGLLSGAACHDTGVEPDPDPTLLGAWIISRNAQLWGVDGGILAFQDDGTVTLRGATFAEGGYTQVERPGTWTADESFANTTLLFDEETTRWEVRFSRDEALFLEIQGDRRWFLLIRPGPD